jgi:hypothetical protein
MTRLMAVDFRGAEILGVELEGIVFVVFKPVVEAIGLAWHGQLERIKRDPVLSEGIRNRGKSRGNQAVAQRCLTIAGKYGTSGWFGTASREPR